MKNLRIALAQINPTVGDLPGNTRKIISFIRKAGNKKADIVAFPELAVTGYPPEDLLLKRQFVRDNMDAVQRIRGATEGITAVVGFVDEDSGGIYNAAAVISGGRLVDTYHKKHLPNYGVFDEYRYFRAGRRYPVYNLGGVNIGVNICEDIWHEKGPAMVQALAGAQLIININASPYHMGKAMFRERLVSSRAREYGVTIAYINTIGGQDELVFDGGSFIADPGGEILLKGKYFSEDFIIADIAIGRETRGGRRRGGKKELKSLVSADERIEKTDIPWSPAEGPKPGIARKTPAPMTVNEKVYNALMLGTRDYVNKNGFRGVVIGMSGGVDSALVTTIAVDSLGRENVHGLFMPSVYTSKESREDAYAHAGNLGIEITTIPVDAIFRAYLDTLSEGFRGTETDITEENLQARIRGNILMAFSNKFGWLVLTTGNKSEMSVGYATLYGDMAGGFAVIKDVPKTLVYELCRWRNEKEGRDLIPERILLKEPTAELRPGQKDTDSLPPYHLLDPVLKAYVEEDRSFDEIIGSGCDVECVRKVIKMVDRSEYKRRQAPPGVKITPRAFGKDRRFPITNRYKSC